MGEIAEMMLDGTMCQTCGEYIESKTPASGFPRYCWSCMPKEIKDKIKLKSKTKNQNGRRQN